MTDQQWQRIANELDTIHAICTRSKLDYNEAWDQAIDIALRSVESWEETKGASFRTYLSKLLWLRLISRPQSKTRWEDNQTVRLDTDVYCIEEERTEQTAQELVKYVRDNLSKDEWAILKLRVLGGVTYEQLGKLISRRKSVSREKVLRIFAKSRRLIDAYKRENLEL